MLPAESRGDAQPIFLRTALLLGVGGFLLVLCASIWFENVYEDLLRRNDRRVANLLAEAAAITVLPFVFADDDDGLAMSLQRVMAETLCTDVVVLDKRGRVLAHAVRATLASPDALALVGDSLPQPTGEGVAMVRPGQLQAWARIEASAPLGWVRLEMPAASGLSELVRARGRTVATGLIGGAAMFSLVLFALTRAYRLVDERERGFLQTQRNLLEAVYRDRLTGLLNRAGLSERLQQALQRKRGQGDVLAVCFLDLDGFKAVNDCWGHDTGDLLLVEVARRLEASVRASDTVARLAGDEFVLLLYGESHAGELHALLDRLIAVIGQPIKVRGDALQLGVSIGVAIDPSPDADMAGLLRQADEAMYEAKRSGRNRWVLHHSADGGLFSSAQGDPVSA